MNALNIDAKIEVWEVAVAKARWIGEEDRDEERKYGEGNREIQGHGSRCRHRTGRLGHRCRGPRIGRVAEVHLGIQLSRFGRNIHPVFRSCTRSLSHSCPSVRGCSAGGTVVFF